MHKYLPERDSEYSARALERNSGDGRLLRKVSLFEHLDRQGDRHTKQDQMSTGWLCRGHLPHNL